MIRSRCRPNYPLHRGLDSNGGRRRKRKNGDMTGYLLGRSNLTCRCDGGISRSDSSDGSPNYRGNSLPTDDGFRKRSNSDVSVSRPRSLS